MHRDIQQAALAAESDVVRQAGNRSRVEFAAAYTVDVADTAN